MGGVSSGPGAVAPRRHRSLRWPQVSPLLRRRGSGCGWWCCPRRSAHLHRQDVVPGLGDLTRKASELGVTVFRPLEVDTVLVIEYLALILIISHLVRWLERRLGTDQNRSRE